MSKLSNKQLEELDLFIKHGVRKRICFNDTCKKCLNECKQSYKADLIYCPHFKSKRSFKNEE